MKKIILYITIFFINISTVIAQSNMLSFEKKLIELENERKLKRNGYNPSSKNEPQELTGLEKDRGKKAGYTPEWSYFYALVGKPILSINGNKKYATSTHFGHRRFANNFLYGIEYGFVKKKDYAEISDLSIHIGYQTTWKHRFKPFLAFHLGTAEAEYSPLNIDTSGYKNSLDLGLQIIRRLPVHFFTGMRYNIYNFEDSRISDVKSQEFYFTLGFEF